MMPIASLKKMAYIFNVVNSDGFERNRIIMTSINQAIFSYPDGSGAVATCPHHYKLVAFAQSFAQRTGARVESIVRRHDVCGPSCGRLTFGPCRECGDTTPDAIKPQGCISWPTCGGPPCHFFQCPNVIREGYTLPAVTKTSPLVPIPSPLDRGKVSG